MAEDKLYVDPVTLAAYEKAMAEPRVCAECGKRLLFGDAHVKAWPNSRGIKCLTLVNLNTKPDCAACFLEYHGGEVNPSGAGTPHTCGKGGVARPQMVSPYGR